MRSQTVQELGVRRNLLSHDVKVCHHSGGVMLEDVTVIHPFPRPVVRKPGDPHALARRDVHSVLPGKEIGRLSVYFQNLEKESVQMNG